MSRHKLALITMVIAAAILSFWRIYGVSTDVAVEAQRASALAPLGLVSTAAETDDPTLSAGPASTIGTALKHAGLKSLAETVNGLRAPAAARREYAERLGTEADLRIFTETLIPLAEQGDLDAAASIASAHLVCSMLVAQPPRSEASPSFNSFQAAVARCAGFGTPGPLTAHNLQLSAAAWTHVAAQLGHLKSMLADRSGPQYFAKPVVTERELRMRAAIGELARRREYAEILDHLDVILSLTHPRMQQAWKSSLCALAQCDGCNPLPACSSYAAGSSPPDLSPREQREFAAQSILATQALTSGDLSAVWRPSSRHAP